MLHFKLFLRFSIYDPISQNMLALPKMEAYGQMMKSVRCLYQAFS